MVRQLLRALILGVGILTLGSGGPGASANAQGCLSTSEARQAVTNGKVLALSRVIGQVRSVAGGEVLPSPKLCLINGHYMYLINVLTGGGQVMNVMVDAASGSIVSY
jgi:uncharacterized membrane protein YkoI